MLIRTHLVITLFFILLLISVVEHKVIFFVFAVLATYVPDIDSRYSSLGRRRIARILQFFTKHRGITHSFTFLILIAFLIALFFPKVSLGFFVGYASHLIADSFTKEGIRPFYPLKVVSRGGVTTGGIFEKGILYSFIAVDILIFVWLFLSIF